MVAACPSLSMLEQLRFFQPQHFRAIAINNHVPVWEHLLSGRSSTQVDFMEIIKEGVKIHRFFKPFKGNFKGSSYNSQLPPPMHIKNAKICERFRDFITDTIIDWVSAGVLAIWGRVGAISPPHLVLPLTVEPSKPRLYGAFLVSKFKLSIQRFDPSIQTFNLSIQTFDPSIQICNCSVQTFDPPIQTFNLSVQIWNGSIQTFHHSIQIWNCLFQTFDSSIQTPFSSIKKCHSSS